MSGVGVSFGVGRGQGSVSGVGVRGRGQGWGQVSLSAHRLGVGEISFAVGEVGPRPVALGMAPPLPVLCAHFGRQRWKHISRSPENLETVLFLIHFKT